MIRVKIAAAIFSLGSLVTAVRAEEPLTKANVQAAMQKVADWQVNDWQTSGFKRPKFDWTYGAAYTGIFELGNLKGGSAANKKYLDFLVSVGQSMGWNTGKRRLFADDYCVGQTYVNLSMALKDKKMIAPFILQADSIAAGTHTEPLEWRNKIQEREWAWCDALFMGPPGLAYLSTATGNPKYLDTTIKLWWKTTDFLYDPAEHLYFRDASYFGKTEKNGKKVFWSRGNGWVMAGLVRVLDNVPAKSPERGRLLGLYKEMAARIIQLQQADGSWHTSLLDPDSYPTKETSGTGFYTYALLWGLNNGVLDKKTYWPVIERAWRTLNSCVHENGMMGFVQPIGAAPALVDGNSTDTYGAGAFLLAGSQLFRYLDKK